MQEISDIQEVFGNPGILDILECRAIQAVRASRAIGEVLEGPAFLEIRANVEN